MKVYLPSNGLMGIKSIEMRPPKINDVRRVPELDSSSTLRKTEVVKMLADPVEVDKVSPSDRDYLFLIAVGAITMNQLSVTVQCPCGHVIDDTIPLFNTDPIRLSPDLPSSEILMFGGNRYTFNRISVKMETEIEERAVDAPDELYDACLQDGIVAMTMFKSLNPKSIEAVKDLDLAIYYAGLIYNNFLPHGITLTKQLECPVCGKQITTSLPITGSILNINVGDLLRTYVDITSYVSMQGFYDMTLPEFNNFITALNQKLKEQQQLNS